ncbi:MAG: polyphosphate kinase 2 family protein [Actinomycetota bacterium]|nr:polyphosphate kinase 2 family protein [Actinomycetota bacterium]
MKQQPLRRALAVPAGTVDLARFDSAAVPGAPVGKRGKINKPLASNGMVALQERLYAEATAGSQRRILLILQGMDTAGKGGVTNHVVGNFEPIGVQYTAFKKPTAQELAHGFLWRVRKRLPEPGIIGVFDRSHYEDVLVPRVHHLVSREELDRRYDVINDFEAELAGGGTTIIKCFLHVSYDTQRKRLLRRLDRPEKRWKFNEADVAERAHWADYAAAYQVMLERCNTERAPWFVVPSDSKKHRDWAVGELLRETLVQLDPQYPQSHLDVEAWRARLAPPN